MTVQLFPARPTAPDRIAWRDWLVSAAAWKDAIGTRLDDLDARAARCATPDAYADDVTLARALQQSIVSRYDQLSTLFDGGRVNAEVFDALAAAASARLSSGAGSLGMTLHEAASLLVAQLDQLESTISHDVLDAAGITTRVDGLRSKLDDAQHAAIGFDPASVELVSALSARLASLTGPQWTGSVDETKLEADSIEAACDRLALLLADGSRARVAVESLYRSCVGLQEPVVALVQLEALRRARCEEKILNAPKLPVPSAPVHPTKLADHIPASPQMLVSAANDWDVYLKALQSFKLVLERNILAFDTCLSARDDLRGLLEGYRAMAGSRGLSEDAALAAAYSGAHDALWVAPCDIDAATKLVSDYQDLVRARAQRPQVSDRISQVPDRISEDR